MSKPKVATAILTRNLPHIVDQLVESLDFINPDDDLFILENGSDEKYYSKYSNLFEKETKGISWGVNKLIGHCFDLGYDYIWFHYNDTKINKPEAFLEWAISKMEEDQSIGIITPYWGDTWDINGRKNTRSPLVSTFSPQSYLVSRKALQTLKDAREEFDPFWDSSHFSGHLNILSPCYYLYSNGMKIITNTDFEQREVFMTYDSRTKTEPTVEVIPEPEGVDDVAARGCTDEEWKDTLGPAQTFDWLNRFFPEVENIGDKSNKLKANKAKRDFIIQKICQAYRQQSD